jgi:hypothetical protein
MYLWSSVYRDSLTDASRCHCLLYDGLYPLDSGLYPPYAGLYPPYAGLCPGCGHYCGLENGLENGLFVGKMMSRRKPCRLSKMAVDAYELAARHAVVGATAAVDPNDGEEEDHAVEDDSYAWVGDDACASCVEEGDLGNYLNDVADQEDSY